jgi:hypothetical protein
MAMISRTRMNEMKIKSLIKISQLKAETSQNNLLCSMFTVFLFPKDPQAYVLDRTSSASPT